MLDPKKMRILTMNLFGQMIAQLQRVIMLLQRVPQISMFFEQQMATMSLQQILFLTLQLRKHTVLLIQMMWITPS